MTKTTLNLVLALALCAAPSLAQQQSSWVPPSDPALVARAKGIHDRVMTMDTHIDINANQFRVGDTLNYAHDRKTGQVDITRMERGGLDAVWLAVYVGQGPLDSAGYAAAKTEALAKFAAIHRLVDTLAPTRVGLALTATDARRIYASGKKVIFIGVENGYSIGADITNVKRFYDLGGRYLSLSHNGNSQLTDSNTGEQQGFLYGNGLSPLGRDVVKEANRLGIMLDFSHPSRGAMMEMVKLSKAPIMGSHSGVRAICNHSRNADDEQLKALAKNGGVIQLVAFSGYVKCDPVRDSLRTAATAALNREFGIVIPSGRGGGRGGRGGGGRGRGNVVLDSILQTLPQARREEYVARQAAITAKYPPVGRATVSDFVDHIDYTKKLIGIDHIGISSDMDGGGGVDGWNSAAETFNVTLELVKRGYTEQEIGKIWSGNLLRVLEQCDKVAKDIQAGRITM